jgi:lycopene cyclase domain-containing protein
MSLYLFLDLASVSIPFLFSFHPRLRFYQTWKTFFPAMAISASLFIIWDIVFTRMGIWGFNPVYLQGIYLKGLPLEEYLFFICIPYASIFSIHAFGIIFPNFTLSPLTRNTLTLSLAGLLIITGLVFNDRWYTVSTGLVCGTLLLIALWYKSSLLNHFFLAYPFILIFFFLVNGILTGSFIEGEVVWYNDAENLGIRMGTIPVEDTFYGMGLLLLTVLLNDFFKSASKKVL